MSIENIITCIIAVVALLAIARLIARLVLRTNVTRSILESDCNGIAAAGFYFSVFIITGGILSGPGYATFFENLLWIFVYGIGGIFLLLVSTRLASRLLLHNRAGNITESNAVSVGIVTASIYISGGMIISGAMTGEMTGEHLPTVVFLLLGWAVFLLFLGLYRTLTDYNDYEQIFNGNIAVAISYSANMIAIGIIIGNAVAGNFEGWSTNLAGFGKSAAAVAMLYFVRQFLVQGLLLHLGITLYGGRLDREIAGKRNIAASAIEAATYIGVAILVTKLV